MDQVSWWVTLMGIPVAGVAVGVGFAFVLGVGMGWLRGVTRG